MLPVIIFEPDQDTRDHLRQCVFDYCKSNDGSKLSFQLDTDSLTQALKMLREEGGITLLMLSVAARQEENRRGAVQLGRKALQQNRDNYTLYCLHNPGDLEALLNTGARPAGVLLKPFEGAKLDKILSRIDRDFAQMYEEDAGDCLVVDSGNTAYRVPFSQILYIEALDKKLTIWTSRQSLTVRMTLQNLEGTLPPEKFFRCHRSYLINTRMIDHVDFTGMEVILTSGDALPLSKTYRDKLREMLDQERMRGHGA